MAVDFIELIEVVNALPCEDFFRVYDGGAVERDDIDAAEFVDHSADFMKAMNLAMRIKMKLEAGK